MIEKKIRTGIVRFYERYPKYPRQEQEEDFEYLGVGAMMVPIGRQNEKGLDNKL